ncbi:hypothetical protein [Pandoraea sputorum]|uniref:hypothetical protein n=1 Tax=Pandoraea sputorum TaxID=93222 RepID=UPI001241DC08|nr:hypothetical protein [Pandoraea sputorum]VVE77371.1 hypothetical protein PSP31120_01258 [Pandoraea sputorum]
MKTLTLLVFLLVTLAGCCTTSGGEAEPRVEYKTKVVDTACDWTKPIYVSKADVLTDQTAADILAHNRAGAKVCGWKPKQK